MGSPNLGLFTSTTAEWPTPQSLFDALDDEFGFTLDPCASDDNAKCSRYFTIADDGLSKPWDGVVFMNPPYGRVIGAWIRKAYEEAQRGAVVVCLIPARTDTAYWHDYVMKAHELRFLKGRVNFDCAHQEDRKAATGAHNAPFPSVVVVFRPGKPKALVTSAIDRQGRASPELHAKIRERSTPQTKWIGWGEDGPAVWPGTMGRSDG